VGVTLLPYALLLLAVAFWGYCLVDYTRTDPRDMRTLDPTVWLFVLVLGSVAGGVVWMVHGRPQRPA
jgi:hypothetical protein